MEFHLRRAALALCLVLPASAQERPTGPSSTSTASAPHQASLAKSGLATPLSDMQREKTVHASQVEDTVWVRGVNYKASFSAEGTSFYPFLGSDAPRLYPVTFGAPTVTIVSSGKSDREHSGKSGPLTAARKPQLG